MKQLYDEEETVDGKSLAEKPNAQPLKYLVININRSSWEVIAVPLIFLSKETEITFVVRNF